MAKEKEKPGKAYADVECELEINNLRNELLELRLREEKLIVAITEARRLIDEHVKHLNPIASGLISGAITAVLILTFKFTGVL